MYTRVLKADWTGEGEGVWSVGHVVHMVIKIKIKIKKNRAQLLYVCQLCVCMYGEEVLDSSTYIRFSNPPGDEKTPVQRAPKVSKTPGPAGPKKKKKIGGVSGPSLQRHVVLGERAVLNHYFCVFEIRCLKNMAIQDPRFCFFLNNGITPNPSPPPPLSPFLLDR